MALVYVTCILVYALLNTSEAMIFCNKTSSCSCMSGSGLIDLSPLALTSGPKYKDVAYSNGDKFSWNPCNAFTEGTCKNVAVCLKNGTSYFNAGNQDSATFKVYNGALTVMYSVTDPMYRSTIITLVCDPIRDGNLIVVGEYKPASYALSFNSKYACPNASGTSVSPPLSPGSTNTGNTSGTSRVSTINTYATTSGSRRVFDVKVAGTVFLTVLASSIM